VKHFLQIIIVSLILVFNTIPSESQTSKVNLNSITQKTKEISALEYLNLSEEAKKKQNIIPPNLDYPEPPVKTEMDFYKLLFKMVIATTVAVVFILMIFLILKKKGGFGYNKQMRILDQFQFMPGKSIHIVELYGKILILGTSGDNITLLSEVNDLEEKKQIKLDVSQKKQIKK
jgi:flagellar biogenesis protein FliO